MEDFENFERTQSFAQIKLLWNRTLCSRHCLALWVQRVTTRSPRLERTAVSGRNVSVTGHFCVFGHVLVAFFWEATGLGSLAPAPSGLHPQGPSYLPPAPSDTDSDSSVWLLPFFNQLVVFRVWGFDLPGQPGSRFAMVGR